MSRPPERVWIVGPGRLGTALGALLREGGLAVVIGYSGRRELEPGHPFRDAPDTPYSLSLDPPIDDPTAVFLTVPDREIAGVAAALAGRGLEPAAALHGCGSFGPEALAPLAAAGWSTAVLHPLAPLSGAPGETLRGALFGVSGGGAARHLAERLVEAAAGRMLTVAADAAPRYHAAAVLASGGVVALLEAAMRTLEGAGVEREAAEQAVLSLATRALAGTRGHGTAAAVTGPVVRGDADTVALHLERLSGVERTLYCALGREALALADRRDLPAATRARLEALLSDTT